MCQKSKKGKIKGCGLYVGLCVCVCAEQFHSSIHGLCNIMPQHVGSKPQCRKYIMWRWSLQLAHVHNQGIKNTTTYICMTIVRT